MVIYLLWATSVNCDSPDDSIHEVIVDLLSILGGECEPSAIIDHHKYERTILRLCKLILVVLEDIYFVN